MCLIRFIFCFYISYVPSLFLYSCSVRVRRVYEKKKIHPALSLCACTTTIHEYPIRLNSYFYNNRPNRKINNSPWLPHIQKSYESRGPRTCLTKMLNTYPSTSKIRKFFICLFSHCLFIRIPSIPFVTLYDCLLL